MLLFTKGYRLHKSTWIVASKPVMQTFLPYSDFQQSVACLDYRRLGKQRVEAFQLLRGIFGVPHTNGWSNHPAMRMWRNYPYALAEYYNATLDEWVRRGYNNNMQHVKLLKWSIHIPPPVNSSARGQYRIHAVVTPCDKAMPEWLCDDRLHNTHRSNLMCKDSEWYSRFNWDVPINLDYWWPV